MFDDRSRGLTSIYVLLLLGVGICIGAVAGLAVEHFSNNGVTIGLISGLIAVVAAWQARFLAEVFLPLGTVPDMGSDKFPRVVLVNIVVVSLMGGLAGHDVSNAMGETSGMFVGALAGVFATFAMLVLMVTYFHREDKHDPSSESF
jgi:hypothetical protein